MRLGRLLVSGCASAAVALVLAAAAAADTGFVPVDPESPGAQRATDIYYLISAVSIGIFLIVTVPLAIFVVRFRRRGRDRSVEGSQIRGNTNLELAWTVLPTVIVAIIVGYVFYKLPGITELAGRGDPDLEIRVEGRQFYWQYEYPNGAIAVDELVVPVDRITELAITAPAGDVIHSFWVPALSGKFDAIPGHVNRVQFQPQKVGMLDGVCGEFCGIQHAVMRLSVRVLPAEEFDRWLEREGTAQAEGTSDLGQQLWERACAKCHGEAVAGEVGPALEGNALLKNREGVEQIVRHGRGAMPAVGEGWSQRQMNALLDYLEQNVATAEPNGG